MTTKQFEIMRAVESVERGVWFTLGVISKRADCSKQTARKHINAMVKNGELFTSVTLYNNNVNQTLYMRPEDMTVPHQMDMFEGELA